jgi:hypothetical protein
MATAPARQTKSGSRPWRGARPGSAGSPAPSGWRLLGPAAAGIGYLAAWAAGLAAWPVNLALNATDAQVAAAYRAHPASAVAQYLLAEGLAGLLLGVVLAAALISARAGRSVLGRLAAAAAAAAVVISLLQAAIGMFLVAAATHLEIARAGQLSDLVTRIDGVKMLALAGVAAYLAARGAADRRSPNWLRITAGLAAAALAVSGLDYLLLASALAWTVYLSGPLLLLWISGTGIWLTLSRPGPGHGPADRPRLASTRWNCSGPNVCCFAAGRSLTSRRSSTCTHATT